MTVLLILLWALFLTTCLWSLWLHAMCGSTEFITGSKSIQLKLFFFFLILLFVQYSHPTKYFRKRGRRQKPQGWHYLYISRGLQSFPRSITLEVSLLSCLRLPLSTSLSYPFFPCPQCALIFAVKMVSYLLHRGIVSLS